MEPEYWEIIAERIVSLRTKRNFAVHRLATMSGVDAATIESIEKGQSKNPKIKTLHKIAIGFNMTLAEFLDFQEMNEYSFDDERAED